MRKLRMLAYGLAVLVGAWAIGKNVATAQVASNDPRIALVDNCDPPTFNAVIPGVCAPTPHRLDTTFAEFFALLFSPLTVTTVGHPAWNFSPGYISIRARQAVRVTNAGGEGHTFTEVASFGGGFVPILNGVGVAGKVPLVPAAACVPPPAVVAPGTTIRVGGLSPGEHKFQCCIHPWMHAVVDVEE